MNILITGNNGQLGTELSRVLARGSSALGTIPIRYLESSVTGVDIEQLDIANADAVRDFFGMQQFDIVFNCAAMTNVDACESDLESAMKVNAIGARNLALATAESGGKFVHISTDYVFSGEADTPYAEWDTCAPNTVYGKSKLLGERYVMVSCPSSFVVRTSWLYGLNGNNFVKAVIKTAREKGYLKVVCDQLGSPTNAEDLVHHLLKIALSEYFGLYHCTGGGVCSWYDFAREIVRLAGIPCEVTPCSSTEYPRPARRPAYSALDNLALRCTVGNEMRRWEDALKAFMRLYLCNCKKA